MNQVPENILKDLINQHSMWLDNPTTQTMLKLLRDREQYYDKKLTDGVRLMSNKEEEDKLRSCISTCKALREIISNSERFVEFTTTKPSQYK